ncbi:MAG TPA: DUF2225 domain-containing protein [Candidatus Obscuribacterales bacterium]
MFRLIEVGVKCPRCGISFLSRQLPAVFDSGIRNSELRQEFKGVPPQQEQYVILSCPSCGKSDWSTTFRPINERPVLTQPNVTAHLQYRQAALEAERGGSGSYAAAMFYLHAAWCADDARAYPQAREYRRLAIDALRRSLIDGTCPHVKRGEIEYLIGELLRRSGDFDASREYFRQVIGQLPGKFAFMARKLMRLAEMRSVDSIPFEAE